MTKTVAIEETALTDIVDDLHGDDEVVVTRDGRPVAKVVPLAATERRMTLEELRQAVTYIGDVESPVDDWDVER